MRILENGRLPHVCRPVLLAAVVCGLGGCALVYEKDGVRYTTGLVHIEQPLPAEGKPVAGDALSVSTVGLGIMLLPSGTVITLGYARDTIVELEDNRLVCGELMEGSLSVKPVYRCRFEGKGDAEQNHEPESMRP
ncbi:MAG: hypothetical protein EP335_15295 [Alphaproteobacteria bacterium]|nr:MAG: hypothetical protein EP335_15295 [Alphaproteobacteria bacterium]